MPRLPASTCGNRSRHGIVPWLDRPGADAFGACIDNFTGPCRPGPLIGACRCAWNRMPARRTEMHDVARMEGAKPRGPTFCTPGKAFTQLRRAPPWLETMPHAPVRYTFECQADAWKRSGEPRSSGRTRGDPSGRHSAVRLPDDRRREPESGQVRALAALRDRMTAREAACLQASGRAVPRRSVPAETERRTDLSRLGRIDAEEDVGRLRVRAVQAGPASCSGASNSAGAEGEAKTRHGPMMNPGGVSSWHPEGGTAGPSRRPARHSGQHAGRIRFRRTDDGPCDVEIMDGHRGRKT